MSHINDAAEVIDYTWTFEPELDEHPARIIAQALDEAGLLNRLSGDEARALADAIEAAKALVEHLDLPLITDFSVYACHFDMAVRRLNEAEASQ